MKIEHFLPSQLLRAFIKAYLIIETPDNRVNKILPDTSIVMALRFKGQVSFLGESKRRELPTTVISGLRKSRQQVNYSPNSGNILVQFREGQAGVFVREPLHELFEESISLDCLSDFQDIHILEEQIAGASNNKDRVSQVDQFFLRRLVDMRSDKLVQSALDQIRSTKGTIRIRPLADELCISLDAFEKRFRRKVGISPKQFSYLTRMKSIVQGGIQAKTFTEAAMAAGYFDQAHFNKDFKLYTGQTPTEFLQTPRTW